MAVAQHIETSRFKPNNGHEAATGKLQGFGHLPERLPWRIQLREWLRHNLGQGWEQVVVNKSVDSVTMPKWVASAILIAVLGFGIQSWWARTADHDTMIEIRTELRLAKEVEKDRALELKGQADLNKVYIDNMTSQLNVIKGMLSQQQINALPRKEN